MATKKYSRRRDRYAYRGQQAPYTVVTFYRRRDNQGTWMLYRGDYAVSTYHDGLMAFEDRYKNGKNVYVVLYGLNSRMVREWGDARAVEEYAAHRA